MSSFPCEADKDGGPFILEHFQGPTRAPCGRSRTQRANPQRWAIMAPRAGNRWRDPRCESPRHAVHSHHRRTMTLILSNDDVEKLLTMRECIAVMEEAYVELADGRGVSRTRSDCFTPTARADALYSLKSMDGVAPKLGVGAVRINSDIVTWPKRGNAMRREKVAAAPNNRYVGLVLLFSVENGEPLAILPDGVMQRMRVGAANGLGIKYLARTNAKRLGLLGSGWQAGAQLMAACAVRA